MNVNRQGGIGRGPLALRLATLIAFSPAILHAASPIDRTRLPIADPEPKKVYQPLPADVPLPKPFRVTPPKDAPNILIILMDDIGFGAPSPFGGSIQMPTQTVFFRPLADLDDVLIRLHSTRPPVMRVFQAQEPSANQVLVIRPNQTAQLIDMQNAKFPIHRFRADTA